MSTWNYRLLAFEHKGEPYFEIYEVFYNEDGVPDGCTQHSVTVGGENKKAIKWVLKKMKEALKKPILWGDDRFPEEYLDKNDKETNI